MKRLFLFLALICTFSLSAKEDVFPTIELEALTGLRFKVPNKKPTLLVIGFEKECITQACGWEQAIRKEKLLSDDIELYSVAVLGNSWAVRMMHPFVLRSLRQAIPKNDYHKVCVTNHEKKPLQKFLASMNSSEIVLILLDKAGCVRWRHIGSITQSTKNSLKQEVTKL